MRYGALCAGSVKACYGHSEGSAGAHGALLALLLLDQQAAAPTMHLRNLNPYVEAAFADTKRACHASTVPPRVSPFTETFQAFPQNDLVKHFHKAVPF